MSNLKPGKIISFDVRMTSDRMHDQRTKLFHQRKQT